MAYTTINKSTAHFNTKLYTGNNSTQSITGVGFQPDFSWFKSRGTTAYHNLYDAVRGATKIIQSNTNSAEQTFSDGLTSFDSDGFSLGSRDDTNGASYSMVSWNWKANGSGSANTDSSINSAVSVNTTAGFSVVTYTGTGSAGSVGHGLGVKPDWIISKNTSSGDWNVYHDSFSAQERIKLNSSAAKNTNASIFSSLPTNQVVNIGTGGDINTSGNTHLFYCFASITGYSKFGSYTGNTNNGDGTFVYTGFKPAFIMVKNTARSQNWSMHDSKRPGYNEVNQRLQANLSDAEASNNKVDLLSNGFKWRTNDGDTNGYAEQHIYMAFGQSLVGSNNVPCTAR